MLSTNLNIEMFYNSQRINKSLINLLEDGYCEIDPYRSWLCSNERYYTQKGIQQNEKFNYS